jgi:tetratricopeptide (TPR) repeat protein
MKTLLAVLFLSIVVAAQIETPSTEQELQEGIAAYKAAEFDKAERHFVAAIRNDPKLLKAHLYLAATYADQYIPGSETMDNLSLLQRASQEFAAVLALDPQNLEALKALGSLSFNVKNYEMARRYYTRATEIAPTEETAFYSLGVMDWIESYEPRMALRTRLGIRPLGTLYDKPECQELRAHNWQRVEHGIKMLHEALRLKPDYDDAMAYMNLLYRERADIQCGSEPAFTADTKNADDWVDLTLKTKRDKACAGRKDRFCK